MKTQEVIVLHEAGLHARPAAVFVQTAQKFSSKISVCANGKSVNAKSMLGLLSLGVVKGTNISIQADGEDEEAALSALTSFAEGKTGE